MSHEVQVHQAQIQILRQLLFAKKASFAVLQKTTNLSSDHFKFHIKRLVELGFAEKLTDGSYRLTTTGKEYANKLDTDNNTLERQPKVAVILVIEKIEKDVSYFIVQERLKHPYFGFWGFPGGKIRWGETILQAATRELYEETNLQATFTHRGIYHEHVIETESGGLLEDKIFHIIHGSRITGELKDEFEGGINAWLSLDEVQQKDKRYASFDIEANIGLGRKAFVETTQYYSKDQF